tara:strand:+ start:2117 stop:3217 length:1101 start_codon:yes stop_codon:yes gene_type:complete
MSFNYRFYNSVAGKNTTTSTEGGHVQKVWGLGESAWLDTSIYEFISHTFFSSVEGYAGPNLSTCRSNYNTTWDEDPLFFNMTINGIQRWTVPSSADYTFILTGGTGGIHGGSYFPGFPGGGAVITFTIFLLKETILNLVVGQCPTTTTSTYGHGSPGGGGTWVYQDDLTLIGVAGGGGGTGHGGASDRAGTGRGGNDANQSNESPGDPWDTGSGVPNPRKSSGTDGNNGLGYGGNETISSPYGGAGGGAGWLGKGDDRANQGRGGESRTGNWLGGISEDGSQMYGGFGGGGGSGGSGNAGGGAGGYTGGGAGKTWKSIYGGSNSWGGGAGGGSYVHPSSTNVSMVAGTHSINYANVENGTIQVTKL